MGLFLNVLYLGGYILQYLKFERMANTQIKTEFHGVPVAAQQLMNMTSIHEA